MTSAPWVADEGRGVRRDEEPVLEALRSSWAAGKSAGLATVVRTWKSAPRSPGAMLAVTPDGAAVGSVSGGCVEAATYALASDVRVTGRPVLQRYAVGDEDAFAVGLTCGGTIDIFVEEISRASFPELEDVLADIESGRAVAIATVVAGSPSYPTGMKRVLHLDDSEDYDEGGIEKDLRSSARPLFTSGASEVVRVASPEGPVEFFVTTYLPPPRMIVFGATTVAAAVTEAGAFLGYRTTVCDARSTFVTRERFPAADEIVVSWPDQYLAETAIDDRTVLCVLTHDEKFDILLLQRALSLPVAFVGAMGSRKVIASRRAELRARGMDEASLGRLRAPIGLDIGAKTPAETAVAIVAEIIAARSGGTGLPLRARSGSVRRDRTGESELEMTAPSAN